MVSTSRQLIEQRLRLSQVTGVEPFGEPAIDLGQQLPSLGALTLLLPQTTQAGGGTEFERPGLLGMRHVEGLLEAGLRFRVVVRRLLQQQHAFEPIQFWVVPAVTGGLCKRQCFREYRESFLWFSHGVICLSEEREKPR